MIHMVVDGQGWGYFSRNRNMEKYGDEGWVQIINGKEMTANLTGNS